MKNIKIRNILLFIILFLMLLFWFTRDLDSYKNFNYDEAGYLSVSNLFFKLFFIERDFSNPAWYGSYRNYGPIPQIPKYIIGLSLHLFGYGDKNFEYFYFKWGESLEWNKRAGHVPPADVLYAARFPIAILGVFVVLLIFYICKLLCDWKVAVIALLLASFNPLILLLSRTVMVDIPFVLFSILGIFFTFYFLKTMKEKRRPWLFVFLIGLSMGLAVSSKLLAVITLLTVSIFFLIFLIVKKRKLVIIYLAVILMLTTTIFVLFNPVLHEHPIENTKILIKLSSDMLEQQKINSPDIIFTSFFQKVYFVFKKALITDFAPINSILKLPVDIFFFVFGIIALLKKEITNFLRKDITFNNLLIIWVFITFLGIIYWIPMDRARYYLPLIPCVIIIECYGINNIYNSLKVLSKKKR